MAGLAIGLVQTTINLMPELGGRIAAMVLASVAVFETFGPPIAAFALKLCGDAGRARPQPGNEGLIVAAAVAAPAAVEPGAPGAAVAASQPTPDPTVPAAKPTGTVRGARLARLWPSA